MTIRLLLLLSILSLPLAAEERAADHQALRVMLSDLTTALNEHKPADLAKHLDRECSLTFVDQLVVNDVVGLDRAFQIWFGPEGQLASVRFAPVVRHGTVFTGPDTAWATGVSDDLYTLKDGRSGPMTAHWTASMVRRDGVWKLSTLHAGVNPMINPVLDAATATAKRLAILAAISGACLGILLGVIIARVLMRR